MKKILNILAIFAFLFLLPISIKAISIDKIDIDVYIDKDGKYHIEIGLTPNEFFDKYIGDEIDEYVSTIHGPTEDKKYNQYQ